MCNIVPLPRSRKAPSPVSLLTSKTEDANPRAGASDWIVIHLRPMGDLDQIAQPDHAERARTPHGIVPAESREPVYWAASHTARHSAELSVFRCAMLAFVRDPFMT